MVRYIEIGKTFPTLEKLNRWKDNQMANGEYQGRKVFAVSQTHIEGTEDAFRLNRIYVISE